MSNYLGSHFGNYKLVRLLGQGGFAKVYLGKHRHLNSFAAIKILHTRLNSEAEKLFLQEARILANLNHPHIVRILDFGLEKEIPYFVMEFAPHGSLRQIHHKQTALPLATINTYLEQIASALHYAHSQKLIHRDLKPENILLVSQNRLLLSDFGVALITQSTHTSHNSQILAGTVAYMAPEQLLGKTQIASDQYSLGVIVYEWLCGRRPFTGSFAEICSQHTIAEPPSLREFRPSISPQLEQIVLRSLAKDPTQRFLNVSEFQLAFQQTATSEALDELPLTSTSAPNIYDTSVFLPHMEANLSVPPLVQHIKPKRKYQPRLPMVIFMILLFLLFFLSSSNSYLIYSPLQANLPAHQSTSDPITNQQAETPANIITPEMHIATSTTTSPQTSPTETASAIAVPEQTAAASVQASVTPDPYDEQQCWQAAKDDSIQVGSNQETRTENKKSQGNCGGNVFLRITGPLLILSPIDVQICYGEQQIICQQAPIVRVLVLNLNVLLGKQVEVGKSFFLVFRSQSSLLVSYLLAS